MCIKIWSIIKVSQIHNKHILRDKKLFTIILLVDIIFLRVDILILDT